MGLSSYLIGLSVLAGHFAAAQNCAAEWGQCGGINYSGPTCCAAGNICVTVNPYYYQCTSATGGVTSTTTTTTTTTRSTSSPTTTTTAGSGGGTTTSTGSSGGSSASAPYSSSTTLDTGSTATQAAYPAADASSCGSWELVDNVCCPYYCLSDNESSDCGSCSGSCGTPDSSMCKSGTMWGETFTLDDTATEWHYSRSTHFGLTSGGACGFGMYGLCTSAKENWVQTMLGSTCEAFCTAYPTLCQDPDGTTLRGNFAAPNGDYYTQFWAALAADGNPDNYLSCGECFELQQTQPDGSLYAVGDAGYTPPIYLEIVDSCPCDANPKWCCGPGADHCGEIDFTYGCPLPEGSHHMDLSDIAMGRLQGNGSLNNGVIPIQYRRVPCPTVGNAYIWLRPGAGPYYMALTVVNTANMGSVVTVEAKGVDTDWIQFQHDPNYSLSRPQERYGAWVLPQGAGPLNLPVGLRITAPDGEQIVNEQAITTFTAPSTAPDGFWYIDLGVNFASA